MPTALLLTIQRPCVCLSGIPRYLLICRRQALKQFPWELHQASIFSDGSSSTAGRDAGSSSAAGQSSEPSPYYSCTRSDVDTAAFRFRDLDQHLEARWLLGNEGSGGGGGGIGGGGGGGGGIGGGGAGTDAGGGGGGVISFIRGSHLHLQHEQQQGKYNKSSSNGGGDGESGGGGAAHVDVHVMVGDVVVFTGEVQHKPPRQSLPRRSSTTTTAAPSTPPALLWLSAGRKSPLATKNLLEDTDRLRDLSMR